MKKAVIFDLDNTLYNEDLYFLEVFKAFSKRHNLDFDLFERNFTDKFRLESKDLFTDILKKIDYYTLERQNELFELYKNIDCNLEIYNEAFEIINHLKEKNFKLAIITNGIIEAQKNKVKSLNIQNNFDAIIFAREFGSAYEKPHEKPFLKALKDLNTNIEETLFVGDHPFTDIKGAQNINLDALWFSNGYASNISYNFDNKINSLLEIKQYL